MVAMAAYNMIFDDEEEDEEEELLLIAIAAGSERVEHPKNENYYELIIPRYPPSGNKYKYKSTISTLYISIKLL